MGVRALANRKTHSEEFKREAVRLMESRGERSVEQVADDLGLHSSQLYKWRGRYGQTHRAGASQKPNADELAAENRRLRKELERTQKERELLKKSIAFFVKENG